MPKGPDVPPRVLALIAVAAVLGIVLVLNPFGGADEPITSPTPPPAEEPDPASPPKGESEPSEAEGPVGGNAGREKRADGHEGDGEARSEEREGADERDGANGADTPGSTEGGGQASGGGGGGNDPQELYLDCVADADTRKQIRACEDEVFGG